MQGTSTVPVMGMSSKAALPLQEAKASKGAEEVTVGTISRSAPLACRSHSIHRTSALQGVGRAEQVAAAGRVEVGAVQAVAAEAEAASEDPECSRLLPLRV